MKSLDMVRTGKVRGPLRIVLYGPEGVGKTTFGADAPGHLFMGSERGTEHLDVARIPHEELRGWKDVMQWLALLAREPGSYQTLVVDTLDWLESMLHEFVAHEHNKRQIEDWDFAKGYKLALTEWKEFLRRLDVLRDRRGMWIVLLAHSKVTKFDDPAGESWDRYSLKLHDKPAASAADLVKEWADEVLFANFDQGARKKNKWDRKGVGTNRRLIWTERSAAFDAKNRHSLPNPMPLSWTEYFGRVSGSDQLEGRDLEEALEQFRDLSGGLSDEAERVKAASWCDSTLAKGRIARPVFAKALNGLRCRLEEVEPEAPTKGDRYEKAEGVPRGEGPSAEVMHGAGDGQGGSDFPLDEPVSQQLPKPVARGGAR